MAFDWLKALDERMKKDREEQQKNAKSFRIEKTKLKKRFGTVYSIAYQIALFKLSIKSTIEIFTGPPIVEEEPKPVPNINAPQDTKNKRIIKVDDPEEDNDASNKKYVDNKFTGKFSGSFLAETSSKTVTVVDGLITTVV